MTAPLARWVSAAASSWSSRGSGCWYCPARRRRRCVPATGAQRRAWRAAGRTARTCAGACNRGARRSTARPPSARRRSRAAPRPTTTAAWSAVEERERDPSPRLYMCDGSEGARCRVCDSGGACPPSSERGVGRHAPAARALPPRQARPAAAAAAGAARPTVRARLRGPLKRRAVAAARARRRRRRPSPSPCRRPECRRPAGRRTPETASHTPASLLRRGRVGTAGWSQRRRT